MRLTLTVPQTIHFYESATGGRTALFATAELAKGHSITIRDLEPKRSADRYVLAIQVEPEGYILAEELSDPIRALVEMWAHAYNQSTLAAFRFEERRWQKDAFAIETEIQAFVVRMCGRSLRLVASKA